MKRRSVIKSAVAGAALATSSALMAACSTNNSKEANEDLSETVPTAADLKGRVKHSVCRWTFRETPLEKLCQEAKAIGITAIDLCGPKDWPMLKKYGLDSSMCNGAELSLTEGFNHSKYHEELVKNYTAMIPKVAEAGYKNLICFSGNRNGIDDELGMQNCVNGLKQLVPLAEEKGVMLVMELLNTKVNHPDYQCNRTAWAVELAKRIGSKNFGILYDIYHMQIDEGDIISTIRDNHQYLTHFHTGGVPGRNEIDESQELNYPAICKAIIDTGFQGYIAQEFIPKAKKPFDSLRRAVHLCDV